MYKEVMEMKIKEKNWKKDFEKPIYEEWKKSGIFKFVKKKKIFSIDTPPPYVNTPIHIGQASTYTMMDFFARYHRMKGEGVLFPLGLDRNGLPIEVAAEKRFSVALNEVKREEFINMCKKVLDETSAESSDSFLQLGISFNSWKQGQELGDVYHTDSVAYRTLTQNTFIDLWNAGLVYEDERINNWCPGCRTTLADAEIVYDDRETTFNDIRFSVKETEEDVIIGTTRPELIATCGMVIFHPDDDRYKHLGGKTAITPIFNKEVPIKAHPMAEIEKGTGIAMMCSAGDQSDIRFFREQNLTPVIAINKDGRMNGNAGFLEGLTVHEARKKIIESLRNENLLVKQKKTKHRTPICERSKDEIEFIAMPELYLKQLDMKNDLTKIADKINFYPPKSKKLLTVWIDSVSIDWPISRRRYYATEIPLWYCKKCGKTLVPPKGRYYQPWRENPPIRKCTCGSGEFRGEERVFDTWFDSSTSPLCILQWPGKFYQYQEKATLRPQGKEIVRTWLYYTLLKCYLLTKKPIFVDVWIHNHIVDDDGKKMSKSIGNIIDPHEILKRFGAEPFRLWCAVEGNLTDGDLRCSLERIKGAGKTLTKLWNVARFISQFPVEKKPEELVETDVWIINETNSIIENTEKSYSKYDFYSPSVALRHFLWETFASHYLEMAKSRAYNNDNKSNKNEQKSALYTIHYCLEKILLVMAPVVPFITHKIYKDVYGKEIHKQKFPKPGYIRKTGLKSSDIIELNSKIWKAKKDSKLSLRDPVKRLRVENRFELIEKDLVAMHNIKTIEYGELEIVL